ncbi:MAG: efflux RND transporter periplasmic adaptor subunit [Arenicella sp.]|nr:efflux RND transporter periplasmic adaptor subunit [Arenicella sp.]
MNMNSRQNINYQSSQPDSKTGRRGLLHFIPRKVRIVSTIILVALAIITLLTVFKPEAQKREIPETVVRVDVIQANRSDYPIVVTANGTVEAETRGNLVSQVRGEIVKAADNFKTGGTFKKGDVLVQIDQRDYLSSLSQARAGLSQAEAAYSRELANAKQAEDDWKRLGNTEPAPDLVLRKPQLAAAKAEMDGARAAYENAQLNLSRTKITAPYDGRIIRRDAVLGQYVGIGTPIAEVFATDGVEVRLPISQAEFGQLGLDRFTVETSESSPFEVLISSTLGNQQYNWNAKISRTDSTFDINTRQIDVIAKVEDPFANSGDQPPLKIGQFVSARIKGQTVDDVFIIPNKSIREGSYIYVVRDGFLRKQSIDIIWQDDQNALIAEGIEPDALVVTTSLNSTLAGAKAKLPDTFLAQGAENDRATPVVGQPLVNSTTAGEDTAKQTAESAKAVTDAEEPSTEPVLQ